MAIYEILKNDHNIVKSLLSSLLNLTEDNAEERHQIIQDIRDELIPHSRAEEAVFYNAIRSLHQDNDKVMHGFKEHLEAETLLRTLQMMDKLGTDEWKMTTQKLKDALEHHINEEETTIFAIAKQTLTQEEADKIGEAFVALKPQVQQEGFMKNTFDLVKNLMPPRFTSTLKDHNISTRM